MKREERDFANDQSGLKVIIVNKPLSERINKVATTRLTIGSK